MAGTKPGSKFKVTQLGKQCLCGCGNIPKQPGSAFWPGHDMRVKGMLSRLERGNLEEKFRLPDVLVARATMDPEFQVHGYERGDHPQAGGSSAFRVEADGLVLL